VSITPFGSPVLPLEKITVAKSSSTTSFSCPATHLSTRYGANFASNQAASFYTGDGGPNAGPVPPAP